MLIARRKFFFAIVIGLSYLLPGAVRAEMEIQLEENELGVEVLADGEPFAQYLKKSDRQPAVFPLIGPTAVGYTRSYPIGERLEFEKEDHPHHRSLWFAHGDVNGFDFWAGSESGPRCTIEHREFLEVKHGTIVTRNDWLAGEQRVCKDQRTLRFGADSEIRWVDFTIDLMATEGDLRLGDTKEGTFAVRVAGAMKVDAPGQGQIVNSNGSKDADAWGEPATWVDYHGPVEGKTVGIAILSHPSNFRHPCRWHVRTYGLFAANPFGELDFEPANIKQGAVTVPSGERLRLRYRVILHEGDQNDAQIARKYDQFAEQTGSGSK